MDLMEQRAAAVQVLGSRLRIVRQKPVMEFVQVTEEMRSFKAYEKLRLERANKRHFGARLKRATKAEGV